MRSGAVLSPAGLRGSAGLAPDHESLLKGDWRFCQHYSTLFLDGRPDKGACAAGGPHQASPRFMFVLPHEGLQGPGTQTHGRPMAPAGRYISVEDDLEQLIAHADDIR